MFKLSVCFVCLGNICRSPTAHGIMDGLVRAAGLAETIHVDSAGTSAWHIGERADERSRATARQRGVELTSRSRRFEATDFDRFDYVLAMDRTNLQALLDLAPDDRARQKVHLFRSFDRDSPALADVPDPYYGGPRGFDDVFDICEAGCRGLLAQLQRSLA